MGKNAPTPPDPNATAATQGQWNSFTAQQQQAMNMIGQDTPWGSLEYQQSGMTKMLDPQGREIQVPQFTAKQSLSPTQQAIFDQTQQAQGNLAGLASDQSDRLRTLLNTPFEFNNDDASSWAYDLASKRILPQQEQARAALDRQLVNRGIRPGTPAYQAEMTRMDQGNTDQMNQLALQGRSQAFQEQSYTRSNPINEITALLSGSQVTQPGSTFTGTPQTQVGGVDYAGQVNSNYQAQMAGHNAQMGGMFGLGGALAMGAMKYGLPMMSDRRAKTDIRRVGETDSGIPIYVYRYIGSDTPQMGVMADEVPADMKMTGADGFERVYYERVA